MNIQRLLGWRATLIGICLFGFININAAPNLTQVSALKEEFYQISSQLQRQLNLPSIDLQRDGIKFLYGAINGLNQCLLELGGWLIQQTEFFLLRLGL